MARARPQIDDESQPLRDQLRRLRTELQTKHGRKDLTDKDFASDLKCSVSTVARAFREDEEREPNWAASMGIARKLGLSAEYTALVLVRDHLERANLQLELMKDVIKDLASVVRSLNPFGSLRRNRRLAARAIRLARGASKKLTPKIMRFESGEPSSDPELKSWCDRNEPELANLAVEIGRVHPIAQSATPPDGQAVRLGHTLQRVLSLPRSGDTQGIWRKESRAQPKLCWYCPPGAGAITLEASPTVYGAVTCEVLTVTVSRARPDPLPTARSVVRCVDARHSGYELAVVTHGALLLTVSDEPLGEEALEETPLLEGRRGVVDHRVYRAGDIFGLNSGRYHRCEFLAAYAPLTCRRAACAPRPDPRCRRPP